jgi:hypothetical protein
MAPCQFLSTSRRKPDTNTSGGEDSPHAKHLLKGGNTPVGLLEAIGKHQSLAAIDQCTPQQGFIFMAKNAGMILGCGLPDLEYPGSSEETQSIAPRIAASGVSVRMASVTALYGKDALQLVLLAVDVDSRFIEGKVVKILAVVVEARLVGVDHRRGRAIAMEIATQPHGVPEFLIGLKKGLPPRPGRIVLDAVTRTAMLTHVQQLLDVHGLRFRIDARTEYQKDA